MVPVGYLGVSPEGSAQEEDIIQQETIATDGGQGAEGCHDLEQMSRMWQSKKSTYTMCLLRIRSAACAPVHMVERLTCTRYQANLQEQGEARTERTEEYVDSVASKVYTKAPGGAELGKAGPNR